MPPLELALFEAINAGPSTAPLVIAGARWISQQLPLAMGGVMLAGFMLGSAAQRRTLLLAAASMALAWVAVQVLRQWVPAPRPAQLG
ncbi:MAG: phosphatase PAP2 family protein, partial [Burkholderiaceae bacterium]|nr:phosphatase PAP2 family protein [Burkholderiaceae bacterium]